MSGTSQILEEYLVKLGYKIDELSLNKFSDGLTKTQKNVLKVGGIVAGVVASVEAATVSFAYSMRKAYFTADLADSSVKGLKGMGFAAKQVGIDSDTMADAVKRLSMTFYMNPGMKAYAETLTGISVEGRKTEEVMIDLMKAVRTQYPDKWAAAQVMGQFGVDPETYKLLDQNLEKFIASKKEADKIMSTMGWEPDKQRAAVEAYTKELDKITLGFASLKNSAMTILLPTFAEITKVVGVNSRLLAQWAQDYTTFSDLAGKVGAQFGRGLKALGMEALGDFAKLGNGYKKNGIDVKPYDTPNPNGKPPSFFRRSIQSEAERLNREGGVKTPGSTLPPTPQQTTPAAGAASPVANPTRESAERRLSWLEQMRGIQKGVMSGMWAAESNRGDSRWLRSPAGAEGPFQFMPGTSKEFGLKNPYDFNESSDAASRKMQGLLKRYKGNVEMALSAYNWGEGNLEKYGMEKRPKETRDYVDRVLNEARLGASAGNTVNQTNNTNITVTGTGAEATAKAVANVQRGVMSDGVRMLKGGVS